VPSAGMQVMAAWAMVQDRAGVEEQVWVSSHIGSTHRQGDGGTMWGQWRGESKSWYMGEAQERRLGDWKAWHGCGQSHLHV
jgi:hypothetical protein